MPRIQEYTQQTEGEGPVGGVSANLEAVSLFGRGVEKFGAAAGEAGDLIFRRKEQEEVSNVYAQFAQARADWGNKLNEQLKNGSLNTDQFKQDYQDFVDQGSQNVSTAAGKNFYNRQAARLGGSLLQRAAAGQAQIAGEKAVDDYTSALNNNSTALMQDPSSFEDVHASSMEAIDAQVQAGTIPARAADKFKEKAGTELAKGAVRGWSELNPDAAKQLLDQGAFDQFFDSDVKKQMYGEVNQAKNASLVEKARADKVQDDEAKQKDEDWRQQALPKLVGNGLSTKEILNSPLDADEKYKWLNMVKAASKEDLKTDPRLKNQLTQRMLLPDSDPNKISDPSQLYNYVGKGLSITDIKQMSNWFRGTPEGQVMTTNRKLLMDMAKSKLVQNNPMMGVKDPDGEYNLLQFTSALQHAESDYRQQGKSPLTLYDPNAPDFFGKNVGKFVRSPQQIMEDAANQTRQQALGLGPGTGPAPIQSNPNAPIPSAGGGAAKGPQVRKQGESPADFLKRIRGGAQ